MAETIEKREIQYNDGKTLSLDPRTDYQVLKCPHLSCDKFYFSMDDLDKHKLKDHAELPNSLMPSVPNKTRYFNKASMYRMHGKVQRENLKHIYLILNVNSNTLIEKIKRWLDKRNKVRG